VFGVRRPRSRRVRLRGLVVVASVIVRVSQLRLDRS